MLSVQVLDITLSSSFHNQIEDNNTQLQFILQLVFVFHFQQGVDSGKCLELAGTWPSIFYRCGF